MTQVNESYTCHATVSVCTPRPITKHVMDRLCLVFVLSLLTMIVMDDTGAAKSPARYPNDLERTGRRREVNFETYNSFRSTSPFSNRQLIKKQADGAIENSPSGTTTSYIATPTPTVTESLSISTALLAGIMIPVSVAVLLLVSVVIVRLLVFYSVAYPESRIVLSMTQNFPMASDPLHSAAGESYGMNICSKLEEVSE